MVICKGIPKKLLNVPIILKIPIAGILFKICFSMKHYNNYIRFNQPVTLILVRFDNDTSCSISSLLKNIAVCELGEIFCTVSF